MSSANFFLPDNYQINPRPEYFPDNNDLVYQPEVYELAHFLAQRSGAKYIIDIGCGSGDKLESLNRDFKVIAIDYGANLQQLGQRFPQAQTIECDLENGLPEIDLSIIKQSVVICSDVVEHIVNPDKLLSGLSEMSKKAHFVLISTPDRTRSRGAGHMGPPNNPAHVREWTIDEFYRLLQHYGIATHFLGFTISTRKHGWNSTILSLSGRFTIPPEHSFNRKIKALLSSYNDEDIIGQVVKYLTEQGIHVHLIDNWSSDRTWEIVESLQAESSLVTMEKFPADGPDQHYQWEKILNHKLACATGADWYMHYDSDEIRCSPWSGLNLRQAIEAVDALGFNAIDHTVINFCPTADDFNESQNPQEFFRFFEFGRNPAHLSQIRTWKNTFSQPADLSSTGGHEIQFSHRRVFPIKFLMKHYPLRTPQQAQQKVFQQRQNRNKIERETKGWHTHYDKYPSDSSFLWKPDNLCPFNPDTFPAELLVKRISGIGIDLETTNNSKQQIKQDQSEINLNELKNIKEDNQKLQQENQQLRDKIDELQSSNSWKITQPIRDFKDKFR